MAKKEATLSAEQQAVVDTTLGVVEKKMKDVFQYLEENNIILQESDLDAVTDNFELQKKMIDALFSWTANSVKLTGMSDTAKDADIEIHTMKGHTKSGASFLMSKLSSPESK